MRERRSPEQLLQVDVNEGDSYSGKSNKFAFSTFGKIEKPNF